MKRRQAQKINGGGKVKADKRALKFYLCALLCDPFGERLSAARVSRQSVENGVHLQCPPLISQPKPITGLCTGQRDLLNPAVQISIQDGAGRLPQPQHWVEEGKVAIAGGGERTSCGQERNVWRKRFYLSMAVYIPGLDEKNRGEGEEGKQGGLHEEFSAFFHFCVRSTCTDSSWKSTNNLQITKRPEPYFSDVLFPRGNRALCPARSQTLRASNQRLGSCESKLVSSSFCLHAHTHKLARNYWECVGLLQRARLTDRNVGVVYRRGAELKAPSEQRQDEGTAWCKLVAHIHHCS